jgi:uncharacterized protein YjbI with pentapeptide repeats
MLDYGDAEAIFMRGLKHDLWKAGIAIAGMLLLLVLVAWGPVEASGAPVRASGLGSEGSVTVQATPTEDATVTALSKEQLTLQVKQLQNQLQNQNNWLANNSTALIAAVTTLVVALFGIFQWSGNRRDARQKEIAAQDKELEDRKAERERRDEEQKRWLKDQEAEREKRAEERFQAAVTGLGDEREGARIGAAILLRTFLRPGYEQFYTQTFDLAVAHLRLPRTPSPPEDSTAALPLTTLSQALIVVFKEAFLLARNLEKREPRSLDATGVQLDHAYLWRVDLKQAFMRQASLREANLFGANLSETNFTGSDFSGASLSGANFSEAYLRDVNFSRANLRDADFSKANLGGVSVTNFSGGNFSGANLNRANFSEAYLRGANFSRANLGDADFSKANLSGANLTEANLEDAVSLEGTNLRGVNGLTKEQLGACKAKGAIIDEAPTTSSSQLTISPLPPSQSNDIQAQSAPSAQESIPTPETGSSSAPISKPGPEL